MPRLKVSRPPTHNPKTLLQDADSAPAMSLRERILGLPPELQDIILDFTVAMEPGVVIINRDYKLPWQLQVSRRTRKYMAQHYYSQSTFLIKRCDRGVGLFGAGDYIARWLSRLNAQHRDHVQHLRFELPLTLYTDRLLTTRVTAVGFLKAVLSNYDWSMQKLGLRLDRSKVLVALPRFSEDGSVRVSMPKYLDDGTMPDGVWATEEELQPFP